MQTCFKNSAHVNATNVVRVVYMFERDRNGKSKRYQNPQDIYVNVFCRVLFLNS